MAGTPASLLLLAACSAKQPPPAPAVAEPPLPQAAVDNPAWQTRRHMHEHLDRATQARDAVAAGHLDQAHEALLWLAEHEAGEAVPVAHGTWLSDMRADAAEGVSAVDATMVGRAVGRLANQCGGCHQSMGLGPVLVPDELPAARGTVVEQHMVRHAWALDALWAGVVGPSPQAWAAGVQALGEPALDSLDLDAGPEQADLLAAAGQAVHELAAQSLEDDNPDSRADHLGQILAACASCHQLLREP